MSAMLRHVRSGCKRGLIRLFTIHDLRGAYTASALMLTWKDEYFYHQPFRLILRTPLQIPAFCENVIPRPVEKKGVFTDTCIFDEKKVYSRDTQNSPSWPPNLTEEFTDLCIHQHHYIESVNPNPKGRNSDTSLIQQQHNMNHIIHRQRHTLFS